MKTTFASLVLCAALAAGAGQECRETVLPSKAHLRYQGCEIMALFHWGPNTFTSQEWGFGNVPPSVVTPKRLDPAQWVEAARAAEIKRIVLVAKHHDGFCLWPATNNLTYSMAVVPAPNTGRDIVREMSDACRAAKVDFGVYLSPWDRHQGSYGSPEYVDYFFAQWNDIFDNYGEITEIWLDGANGGTGWYGGVNGSKGERRSIPSGYYRKKALLALMHEKHPESVAFGGHGEWSSAWCGNEKGVSPETWWCPRKGEDGKLHWIPSEADFPLRRGWFFHANQSPKSLSYLVKSYFETVGRGAVMNIGIAPDKTGRVCDADVKRLAEFGDWVRAFNATNLAEGASVEETREGSRLALEMSLPKSVRFNCVDVKESIAGGQRVESFTAEAMIDGEWKALAAATTVGYRRIVKFGEVESSKVRVKFTGIAPPQIMSVALRLSPEVEVRAEKQAKDTYAKGKWRIVDESCKETSNAKNAIDGNYRTLWCTHPNKRNPIPPPQSFTVDCGEALDIGGFDYVPRSDNCKRGIVDGYEFHVSSDGKAWSLVSSGEFGNIAANPVKQRVMFEKPVKARYFKFTATHAIAGNDQATMAEIDLVAAGRLAK